MRLKQVVSDDLAKFMKIYPLQDRGVAFETPNAMFAALGLLENTEQTIKGYLSDQGVSGSILTELVHAPMKVHYNQGTGINALAGVISLCPLITGEIFKIGEGNKQAPPAPATLLLSGALIVAGLLAKYANSTETSTRITDVVIDGGGQYTVWNGEESKGVFDAVIIATPLEQARISISLQLGEPPIALSLPPREFQTTIATWVKSPGGVLKGVFRRSPSGFLSRLFGREKQAPNVIYLTEEGTREDFSSLGRYGDHYKFFSTQPLSEATLQRVFGKGGYEILTTRSWLAYPQFNPPEKFASFVPVKGENIFYPSAIETAASALEVAALGARNTAILACRALGSCPTPPPATESREL
ncbi:Prenylcysteine lyase [Baffinella frigidus]|nr:Prenylcysteine lyase [Cryptophyta sp. CCMP2293]